MAAFQKSIVLQYCADFEGLINKMSFRITSVSANVARNICRGANKSCSLQTHVVAISELNRSKLGHLSYQRRFIDSNSWASEALEKNGEKLPKGPKLPDVVVDEEALKPNAKVAAVVDQVLSFNILEMNQFVRAIQVCAFYVQVFFLIVNNLGQARIF